MAPKNPGLLSVAKHKIQRRLFSSKIEIMKSCHDVKHAKLDMHIDVISLKTLGCCEYGFCVYIWEMVERWFCTAYGMGCGSGYYFKFICWEMIK